VVTGDLATSNAVSEIGDFCAERFLILIGFSVVKMNALKGAIHSVKLSDFTV
jgi:hypothetical protein